MENMKYNLSGATPSAAASSGPSAESTKKKTPTLINIKELLVMMVMNWMWFLVSIVVFLSAGFLYFQTLQPVYERVSDIEIKTQQAGSDDIRTYMGLTNNESSNINNELYIFRSLKLAREVAEIMHLDVSYYREGTFRRHFMFEDRPFSLRFNSAYTAPLTIKVRPTSAQTFLVLSVDRGGVVTKFPEDVPPYFFGSPLKLPGTDEEIELMVDDSCYPSLMAMIDKDVCVSRISMDEAASISQSMIVAEKQANTVIRITCRTYSVAGADAMLRAVTNVYNEHSLKEKNAVTENSFKFVDERIEETAQELGETESKLAGAGVNLNAKDAEAAAAQAASMSSVESTQRAAARDQYAQIQSSLYQMQSVRNHVESAIVSKSFIPVTPGLTDAGISGSVQAYNQLAQQRTRLISNSSADNPAVRRLDENLESMATTMLASIDATIDALTSNSRSAASRVARYSASSRVNTALAGFDSAAIANKALAITHSYKQEYFQYLLKRREELRLQLAVTNADTRVIEDPMGSTSPVFPVLNVIMVKALAAGVLVPAFIMLVIALLTLTVRGRKDVEDVLTIPFMGELPENEANSTSSPIREWIDEALESFRQRRNKTPRRKVKSNKILITQSTKNALAEAFHIVQSNLSYMRAEGSDKHPQVMMFTSFAPGAGKSFVSVNMASSLATSSTKRCIWIDMDIRKGHKNPLLLPEGQRQRRPAGLSTYLAGKATLEECIQQSMENDHLDIMLAGPVPPNPVQLLMDERLDEMMSILRKRYEYIILDSVPSAVVADAAICNRCADLTVYVIRVGRTFRYQLPEIEKIYQQRRFKNLCCVLNGSIIARRRYGYGYGSGYGYNYGYGYGYGYGYESDKDEE